MIDYKELKEVDLNLFLQSGGSIKTDNLTIKPYTLKEIRDFGYTNYMNSLQWITISMDDFISSIDDIGKKEVLEGQRENLKTFDFYSKLGGQEVLDNLIDSMRMIFRTEDIRLFNDEMLAIGFVDKGIIYEDENGQMKVNDELVDALSEKDLTVIHRHNFDDIVEIVKIQNYLMKPKSKSLNNSENPVDDETKKLMEDMERHRKKVEAKNKAKKNAENDGEDSADISDIISAISSKSNSINKLNVWEFTLYQIYDEYSRLELIDNYDFSIKAMMAGAEKVDLRHWSSKL